MTTPSDEAQRIRQRFDIDLKAEISLAGSENQKHQCRVTNLSASGACLHFETTVAVKTGMSIAIKIAIPATIMHITNSGEIKWVKQQHNNIKTGVRFQEILSEIMMQQLTKNGSPTSPYKP